MQNIPYEVEMKFPVVMPLDFDWDDVVEEIDTYFRHPCRDFAQTDEGLRIRKTVTPQLEAEDCVLTYKGPKIDSETKTRKEIEISVAEDDGENCQSILESLGFAPVEIVRKFRKTKTILVENREYTLSLDSLPLLKDRGRPSEFLEIETIADADTVAQARTDLLRFAQTLIAEGRLGESIRKGYLEMILESNPTF